VLCSNYSLIGDEMAGKQEGYTVSVDGPDHKFKRSIDEATAIRILNLVTGGVLPPSAAPESVWSP